MKYYHKVVAMRKMKACLAQGSDRMKEGMARGACPAARRAWRKSMFLVSGTRIRVNCMRDKGKRIRDKGKESR